MCVTGDADVDKESQAGLDGPDPGAGACAPRSRRPIPGAVDIAEDELALFPLLYWPVPPEPPGPGAGRASSASKPTWRKAA